MSQERLDLRGARKIGTVGIARDEQWIAESEVNEALSLGWVLISVHGEGRPLFVIGWFQDGEAPLTNWERSRWRPSETHEVAAP